MPVHTQKEVRNLYNRSLASAQTYLGRLKVCSRNEPSFAGLTGWVFEQTIEYCIRREVRAKRYRITIGDQVKIGHRGKVDLVVGSVAIEIKQSGIFTENAITRYRRRAKEARAGGLEYLYLTGGERHRPYRSGIIWAVGRENAFFLDTPGQWNRFVRRVLALVKRHPTPKAKSA